MKQSIRLYVSALGLLLGTPGSTAAQRGGGPSEEIAARSGSYFVDVKLPSGEAIKPIALEACSLVQAAAKKGNLSLVYVFDPNKNAAKHEQFEQTIFGHAEISIALRRFQCGRINLAEDERAKAELSDKVPFFVAFDAKGVKVGETSFADYRAKAQPLVQLLQRAAGKHGKLSTSEFVKRYRDFLRDYQVYEGRKRMLDQKRERLMQESPPPKTKLDVLAREDKGLEKQRTDLLAAEKKILELANVPERDPNAKRLGDRRRPGR
jgi:hypothetical protein